MDTPPIEKISLNGDWQIVFDPSNQGITDDWMGEHWPAQLSKPIQVHKIWNTSYPDEEGIAFYRTSFTIPEAWKTKVTVLRFEGVMYCCQVWVNGKFAGSHEGGYTPFCLDINPLIQSGKENQVVVRVAALSRTKSVDGMEIQFMPVSKQPWYYAYGGIWGRVTLESIPWVVCQNTRIAPDYFRQAAQVTLAVHNRRADCCQVQVRLNVIDPYGNLVIEQQGRVTVLPGTVNLQYRLPLPQFIPWTCEQPDLYSLKTWIIADDGEIDEQTTAFGMRDFTCRNGEYFLNGEPIYIRGILLQPNFPETLIVPAEDEMMVREIILAKEAGFNLIRIHLQPAPPGYLDLTDRLGMLVYSETSMAWIRDSPRLVDHGQREIRALIERDGNHPSVVFWGIYNENPPASSISSEELVHFARSIDPTRVIVDNSGGSLAIDQDFGWIDRATNTPSWSMARERVLDVHLYLGSPISRPIYQWLGKLGSGAESKVLFEEGFASLPVLEEFDRECRSFRGKVFVSEIGYGGMSDLDETVTGFAGKEDLLDAREFVTLRDSLHQGYSERGLERVFGPLPNLIQEAQELQAIGDTQQVEALLLNPGLAGYVLTQLNDVSWEFHGGILNVWRKPKLSYYALQRLNQPQVVILKAEQDSAFTGETVAVEVAFVSRIWTGSGCQIMVSVFNPLDEEIATFSRPLSTSAGIQFLEKVEVPVEIPGDYSIHARFVGDGMPVVESTETILCLSSVDWNDLPVKPVIFGESKDLAFPHTGIPAEEDPGLQERLFVAAHPDTLGLDDWKTLFDRVEAGGCALVGELRPADRDVIRIFAERGIRLELHPGIGSWMGCYHWISDSEIFTGLPNQRLAKRPYTKCIPKYILSELGGAVQAGSLRNTQSRREPAKMIWFSDIEIIPWGAGRLILCQYRVFDSRDAVSTRLAYNLLKYGAK